MLTLGDYVWTRSWALFGVFQNVFDRSFDILVNGAELCLLQVGPANDCARKSWLYTYDSDTGECKRFYGCRYQHANSFMTKADCEGRCRKSFLRLALCVCMCVLHNSEIYGRSVNKKIKLPLWKTNHFCPVVFVYNCYMLTWWLCNSAENDKRDQWEWRLII